MKDLKKLVNRFFEHDILALASQLAYSMILSFFPLLIFLFTIVGYSAIDSTDVLSLIKTIMPQNTYELVKNTVIEVFDSRKGNLLSFSGIAMIWVGTSGFRAIIKGLNKAYDEKETRPYWKVVLISILCMLTFSLIIIFAISLFVFGVMIGNTLVRKLGLSESFRINWDILRYFGGIIFMIFAFAALYRLTPCRKLTWKEVLPGATFCTLGWLVASMFFAYYVNNFNNYSGIYGGIGAVIVLMVWLFITSVVILIGGELNAILAADKEHLKNN